MIVTAKGLNVRSGPGVSFRVLSTLPRGARVIIMEQQGDWAWVTPAAGWVHTGYLSESGLAPPVGLAGIRRVFGEPGSVAASGGRVQLPDALPLGWTRSSASRFACHEKMVPIFTAVFQEIYDAGHWSKIRTFDGCYNNRTKTGTSGNKSTHAWGISVDLNASTNRYGTKGDMPPEIIEIFERHGFLHLKFDPMHFQYARGY